MLRRALLAQASQLQHLQAQREASRATLLQALAARDAYGGCAGVHTNGASERTDEADAPSTSGAPAAEPAPPVAASPADATTYTYTAPFGATVKRLKKLSVFSCACTTSFSPLLATLQGADATGMGTAAIAVTIASFGVFTTSLLHWFTGPYVQSLSYDPATDTCKAVTCTLLGRPDVRQFSPSQIAAPQGLRPLSTFQVGDKVYYIDEAHFRNKQLLARLTPPDPLAAAAAPPAAQQQHQH